MAESTCTCPTLTTPSGTKTVRASRCPVHGGQMDRQPPRGHALGDRRRHLHAVPGPESDRAEAPKQDGGS